MLAESELKNSIEGHCVLWRIGEGMKISRAKLCESRQCFGSSTLRSITYRQYAAAVYSTYHQCQAVSTREQDFFPNQADRLPITPFHGTRGQMGSLSPHSGFAKHDAAMVVMLNVT